MFSKTLLKELVLSQATNEFVFRMPSMRCHKCNVRYKVLGAKKLFLWQGFNRAAEYVVLKSFSDFLLSFFVVKIVV